MSNPSTLQDIHENKTALYEFAEYLLTRKGWEYEMDDWAQHIVDDKVFDFNIFLWEDDGDDAVVVTVHTAYVDENDYWQTDMSNFVSLLQLNLRTGEIKDSVIE